MPDEPTTDEPMTDPAPDEPTPEPAPEPGGEMVPPIVDYTPEEVEPEAPPVPSTPPPSDGSPILDGPHYPAPGEVTD